jgi:hypothetical protein
MRALYHVCRIALRVLGTWLAHMPSNLLHVARVPMIGKQQKSDTFSLKSNSVNEEQNARVA